MGVVLMNLSGFGTQVRSGHYHTNVSFAAKLLVLKKLKPSLKRMVFTLYSVKSVGTGQNRPSAEICL